MADTVTTSTIFPTASSTSRSKRLVMRFTNSSDGTGESGIAKVDKSTLVGLNGLEPSKIAIDKIEYAITGMSVKISYDRTSDVTVAIVSGYGEIDMTQAGGIQDLTTGDTGDILFTTIGHSSGDTYDITLHMRKKD
jgi:hypothetical protein